MALAPGTWCNRVRHAAHYITQGPRAKGLDHLATMAYNIAHYTVILHRELPSHASVANALSGTCAWLRVAGTSDTAFTAPFADLVR